ncbi:hypothetical protein [Desulfosporosinus sp. BG]|uniref:hypothetical protein n=1 Tax=Desulfosporosinus sp. BG TaxID=1633135 RepID=UPI00083B6FAD|nr:hypothetical protein [Desulfosporosinus sp. BG]ODA42492.1 hypothetical protein DSBG_0632 [Desulfosporosinus sp. BG]
MKDVSGWRFKSLFDPPPPLVTASFITGIVNLPERMIIQLIPEQILESSEFQILSQITAR